MANWGDYFSNAFTQQNELAQKMAFEKWRTEQENNPEVLKQRAEAQTRGMMAAWGINPNSLPQQGGVPSSNDIGVQGLPSLDLQELSGMGGLGENNPFTLVPGARGIRTAANPIFAKQLEVAADKSKDINSKLLEGKYKALQSAIKDSSVLGMFGDTLSNLMNSYDEAKKGGFAGNWYAEKLGQISSSGFQPLGSGLLPLQTKEGGLAANKFIAARNEAIMRMQPIMSEQFGERGSMRIMDSMIKMGQQELGNLNEPRWAVAGKAQGTLQNMYRFLKGSADYAKKINLKPEQLENMDSKDIDAFVRDSINSTKISKEEKEALSDFVENVTGEKISSNNKSNSSSSTAIPKYDKSKQKLQSRTKPDGTIEYRVVNK